MTTATKRATARQVRCGVVVSALLLYGICTASSAAADDLGYLVNITVRPYHFSDATAALEYGRNICAAIDADRPYPAVVSDVMIDQATGDEYQASYLIAQAADQLCPALIGKLRSSAAGYRPRP